MKTIEVTRRDGNTSRKMTIIIDHISAVDEGCASGSDSTLVSHNGCLIYIYGRAFWVKETCEEVLDKMRAAS